MKKVIIPTDFSVESLQLVDFAVLNFPDTTIDIVLVCGYKVPDTKWGIIHFSPRQEITRLVSAEFEKAKNDLLLEHKQWVVSISVELFTGTTSVAFKDFSETHHITDALIPSKHFLNFQAMKCFDPTTIISKCIPNAVSVGIEPMHKKVKTSILNILKL